MKKVFALLLAAIMTLSLTACGGAATPSSGSGTPEESSSGLDSKNPIYIGVLDALTGERAMSGMYAKEGADMFVEFINANGGVLGRELKVVYEDDQGNETMGTNAYQKLTSEYELSGTVLSKFSSVTLAIEPFVAEMEIPAICTGSSVKIANNANEWLYSMRKSDLGSGISIANAAVEKLGMKKVAILHAPDALGTGMAPVVQKRLEELGAEVVSLQQFSADEKSFAPFIAKMASSGCDGIISIAQQTEAALIMTSVKEAGLEIPRIGSSAFCQQTSIQNAGENCNGWYSVTAWSPTVNTEPAKSWIEAYKAKYDKDPDMSSALTYDALAVLCAAIEKAGSAAPADVNKAMQETKDLQGLGSTYTFTAGTRMMATSEYLTHIEGQKSIIQDTIFSK